MNKGDKCYRIELKDGKWRVLQHVYTFNKFSESSLGRYAHITPANSRYSAKYSFTDVFPSKRDAEVACNVRNAHGGKRCFFVEDSRVCIGKEWNKVYDQSLVYYRGLGRWLKDVFYSEEEAKQKTGIDTVSLNKYHAAIKENESLKKYLEKITMKFDELIDGLHNLANKADDEFSAKAIDYCEEMLEAGVEGVVKSVLALQAALAERDAFNCAADIARVTLNPPTLGNDDAIS